MYVHGNTPAIRRMEKIIVVEVFLREAQKHLNNLFSLATRKACPYFELPVILYNLEWPFHKKQITRNPPKIMNRCLQNIVFG